jgi:hypothetical protein
MLGVLIFVIDLGIKIAYLSSMKFADPLVQSLYGMCLYARGIFILAFHIYLLCMGVHRLSVRIKHKF